MANFILDETAGNINTAINKVLNADAAPTVTDALITSQGVKTYVDSAVSALSTRLTSAEATITAMQNASIGSARYTCDTIVKYNSFTFPFVEAYNGIGAGLSSDGTTITLSAGRYIIEVYGLFSETDNNSGDYYKVDFQQDGTNIVPTVTVNEGSTTYNPSIGLVISGTSDFRLEVTEIPNAGGFGASNTAISFTKIG